MVFFLGYGYVTLVLLDDLCVSWVMNLCWVFLFLWMILQWYLVFLQVRFWWGIEIWYITSGMYFRFLPFYFIIIFWNIKIEKAFLAFFFLSFFEMIRNRALQTGVQTNPPDQPIHISLVSNFQWRSTTGWVVQTSKLISNEFCVKFSTRKSIELDLI